MTDFPDTDLDENSTTTGASRLSSNLTTNEDKDAEIRTLRNDNKKLSDVVKEYKILLTTYRWIQFDRSLFVNDDVFSSSFHRSAPKETRDKANLMASEKKLRQELDETRNELKRAQNYAKNLRKKCSEDEVKSLSFRSFSSMYFLRWFSFRLRIKCDHSKMLFVISKRI